MIKWLENSSIKLKWKLLRKKGNCLFEYTQYSLIFRVEKYERDLKRWEFMDEESERQSKRIESMNNKYLTGQTNKGGAAYNILNLQYE